MGEARDRAQAAKKASYELQVLGSSERNAALAAMAEALVAHTRGILRANERDMDAARAAGTAPGLLDRLALSEQRISDIAEGMRQVAAQPEVLGNVVEGRDLYNGLRLRKVRVPLGVVAMIYEARPNVTADAVALCVKTGNACVLRGGSMALHSCLAISQVLSEAGEAAGLPKGCIQSIESPDHDVTDELMGLTGLVDVLIPRGGAGLIDHCVEHAKVPVIQTGKGNCHVYVHEAADFAKARAIVINAKTQRVGVCNAAEGLLVDEAIAADFLPTMLDELIAAGVVIHGDDATLSIAEDKVAPESLSKATEEDWGREYGSLDISVKVVAGLDEAVEHINAFGTGHSEAIVSDSAAACAAFQARVDASTVYANASTRFSDGGEFGLGAEIGISTQKLHARGPMGAEALTSTKFLVDGDGQVRG